MPIYQPNVWVCEVCGLIKSYTSEVYRGDDPVVTHPNGEWWDYVAEDCKELLACPDCLASSDAMLTKR